MKYKIAAFFISISIVMLTGCLNYTQITTIKTDGSGKMFIHYWMKLQENSDSINIKRLGLFDVELIRNEFTSIYSTLENIEVYEDLSDSTIHAKVYLLFNYFDSLNYAKAFKGANLSIKDGPDGTKIFSQFISPFATGFGITSNDFSITYIYYLPGDILKNNATSISKNKLTWEYTLDQIGNGKLISATYRPFRLKETPIWIYILAGFVILVVLIFIFKRK